MSSSEIKISSSRTECAKPTMFSVLADTRFDSRNHDEKFHPQARGPAKRHAYPARKYSRWRERRLRNSHTPPQSWRRLQPRTVDTAGRHGGDIGSPYSRVDSLGNEHCGTKCGAGMPDPLTKADRYRNEAAKCYELAKS